MVKSISKSNLRFLILSLGLFGNILSVKSQQSGDCGIFQDAITDLWEEIVQKYTTNDCCNLDDITCENNSITKIKFTNIKCGDLRFEPTISKLANLQQLTSFEISYTDRCYGSMPKNISELKNLKSLILNDNGFDSVLPENISKLSNLEKLDLSNNRLHGTIPASYGNLKNLKSLKLNTNGISGAVPYTFNQLENLTELNLAGNRNIKGYIPKMSKVEVCDYKDTGICSLSSTSCNEGLTYCTKDDVKKTNAENGSPDPKAYEGDVQSFKIWWKNNSWKVPFMILGLIFAIPVLFGCCGICSMFDCCSPCFGSNSPEGSEPIAKPSTTTTTGNYTLPSYVQPNNNHKKHGFRLEGSNVVFYNKMGHGMVTHKMFKH